MQQLKRAGNAGQCNPQVRANKALEQTAGLLPALTSLVGSIAKIALAWKNFNFPQQIESMIESVCLAVLDCFNCPAAAQLDRWACYFKLTQVIQYYIVFDFQFVDSIAVLG